METTNVAEVSPSPDCLLHFTVTCSSCNEVNASPITVDPNDKVDMQGSRGTSNFVFKCKFCKRESSANILSVNKWTFSGNDWQTMVIVECRGLEFTRWFPNNPFTVTSSGGSTFNDVDLSDEDGWVDYDEKVGEEVSIMDISHRFTKTK
jgi:hypothetical protein